MISVILVDYFSYEKTIKYIYHFIDKKDETLVNFIIVDNSANLDNAKKILKSINNEALCEPKFGEPYNGYIGKAHCDLIINNKNGGYGPGANLGVRYAIKQYNSEFVIISNNDLRVLDSTLNLKIFLEIFNQELKVGLIGPSITGVDGNNQTPCKKVEFKDRWIIPYLIYPFNCLLNGDPSDDLLHLEKQTSVYRIMGSFMMFRTSSLVECGFFDENTFLYAEESIIAEKLLMAGIKTIYCPRVHLLHEHNQIIGNYYNQKEKLKMRFQSESYYYQNYIGVNKVKIGIAKISLKVYFFKLKIVNHWRGKRK